MAVVGCSSSEPETCKVVCTSDNDCPDDQTCGDLGRCSSEGETCPCTPSEFLGCVDSDANALYCNAAGDGVTAETCGGGCNADAARCNTCTPTSESCNADTTSVDRCAEDGLTMTSESCELLCVGANDTVAAHCGYISPQHLPDVCDTAATEPELTINSATTLDTSLDNTCNGGIVMQASGVPICVVRYGTIAISGSLRGVGPRALALVADRDFTISGTLDVSAVGAASGAGGGRVISGGRAGVNLGGGGAGFAKLGGFGGGTMTGNGGAGGPVLVPTELSGGPRPEGPTNQQSLIGYPSSGGGGGAVTVISCKGKVSLPAGGTIVASGGGGPVGVYLTVQGAVGGTGGGAGGLVVVQGASVNVSGNMWANGGGGGGGCSQTSCGTSGQDGLKSATPAPGGGGSTSSGPGGDGGTIAAPTPGVGTLPGKGGGGGSAGYIRVLVPDSSRLTNMSESSPPMGTATVTIR